MNGAKEIKEEGNEKGELSIFNENPQLSQSGKWAPSQRLDRFVLVGFPRTKLTFKCSANSTQKGGKGFKLKADTAQTTN